MKKSIDKNTLFDFFDGKTTSIQRKMIEEWLLQPDNNTLFYQFLDEWESRRTQFLPDEFAALAQYKAVMENGGVVEKVAKKKAMFPGRKLKELRIWLSAVAACLLLIAAFTWKEELLYRRYDTPYGQTAGYTLSDGTEVTLNSNSRLWAPRFGFGRDSRQVRLEGEAEFHVTRTFNMSRFTVVMHDGYLIEVLGTKFVALSREKNKRVYLTEGKVKLTLPEGRQLYMKPGHLFEAAEEKSGVLSTPEQPQQYLAWTTHQFYFDNTPLTEVAHQMQERFGIVIDIADPELAHKELGGIYEAQNPDDLLQILSELFDIQISQHNNRIKLRAGTNL